MGQRLFGLGRQGAPGVEDVVIGASVPTQHVLAQTPIANSVELFINGLRQAKGDFSVSGSTVTLPGALLLTTGDLMTVSYMY